MRTELRTFNGLPLWVDVKSFRSKALAISFRDICRQQGYYARVIKEGKYYLVEVGKK